MPTALINAPFALPASVLALPVALTRRMRFASATMTDPEAFTARPSEPLKRAVVERPSTHPAIPLPLKFATTHMPNPGENVPVGELVGLAVEERVAVSVVVVLAPGELD